MKPENLETKVTAEKNGTAKRERNDLQSCVCKCKEA